MDAQSGLYPEISPYDTGMLEVPGGHALYYEQCGAPHGVPVLVLHGGPGSGASAQHRRFFDPTRHRAVLFDQRGCGRSQPLGETRHNHTGLLIADIERLREHLGIERWLVFGGSWGAALGACYAAAHKPRCLGAVLRGMFLTGKRDLAWFFGGAAALLPEPWQDFAGVAPKRWRRNMPEWLARSFAGGDGPLMEQAALAWRAWESALDGAPAPAAADRETVERLVAKYRIQIHYLARRCFLGEAAVLDAVAHLRGLPVCFVHGRRDLVCRPENSWRAHRTLAGSRLVWVDGAGHDPFAAPAAHALVHAVGALTA